MELPKGGKKILEETNSPNELKKAIKYTSNILEKNGIYPDQIQWLTLINHLNEMIARKNANDELTGIDRTVFLEIPPDILELAKKVSNNIGIVSEDEMYVLSIHFEVAKQNRKE